MKKGLTDISIIADRSGSMETTRGAVISGFNEFIETQKAVEGQANVSLVLFDDLYAVQYVAKPINDVVPLNYETFVPRGFTALFDAIGNTVKSIGERLAAMRESDRPEHVIVLIMTDGGENASKLYSAQKVREMVEHQQNKYNWQFVFLGANQDAIMTATTFGINAANAMTYSATNLGTTAAYASVARNMTMFRTGAATNMSFAAADHEEQKTL